MPNSDRNDPLQSALNAVWEKSLPLLRNRVTVLQHAVQQLRAGTLDASLRNDAAHEAHRMAGLLGTFGYPEGTDSARLLELALDSEQGSAEYIGATSPDSAKEIVASLESAVLVLRKIVGESTGPRD
jgi:HPt (histidine-containing phosphotransfer) domain-containing protein